MTPDAQGMLVAALVGPFIVGGLFIEGYRTIQGRSTLGMPALFGYVQIFFGFVLLTEGMKHAKNAGGQLYIAIGLAILAVILAFPYLKNKMNKKSESESTKQEEKENR